jgi:hypothetical protein
MSARDWFDVPYEERFNAALPWGYWLIAPGEVEEDTRLVDHEGRRWNSVREYFWKARLGMGKIIRDDDRNKELEFLLAILATMERRTVPVEESAIDIFGSWEVQRHYMSWLTGHRLLSYRSSDSQLSPEGHAILLMLASTRSPDAAPLRIGLPTLRSYRGLAEDDREEELRSTLTAQEQLTRHLQYRFIRQDLGQQPAIVLAGVGLGPNIPLTRVLWSMLFPDSYARDRLLVWMNERVDRWQDWGMLAYKQGARALTERLLQLAFADQMIG